MGACKREGRVVHQREESRRLLRHAEQGGEAHLLCPLCNRLRDFPGFDGMNVPQEPRELFSRKDAASKSWTIHDFYLAPKPCWLIGMQEHQ